MGIRSEIVESRGVVYTEAPRGRGTFISTMRAAFAFLRVVFRPDRLQYVIDFVDAMTSLPVVSRPLVEELKRSEHGRRALREKIRVRLSLEPLLQLPPETLGRRFAEHLQSHGLDPAALPARSAQTDDAYLAAHLYETHDIWHVVTGFKTDKPGELGLQAFYAAQLPSRVAVGILAIGMVQTLFQGFSERSERLEQISRGARMGKAAVPLAGVDWQSLWTTPLLEVQQQLKIQLA